MANRYTYHPNPDARVLTIELPRDRMADLLRDLGLLAFPPQTYGIVLPGDRVRVYLHTPAECAIGVKLLLSAYGGYTTAAIWAIELTALGHPTATGRTIARLCGLRAAKELAA